MPRSSAEAIVLRTRPVGESDLVVTFLTEAEGKLSGSAKNARRSRRRFGGALEPMTRGRAIWSETEGRELVRLESFEATASFAARQADLAWFYLFAYLAEVADTFAREKEPDPRFYRLVRAATDASEKGKAPRTVRRWFETWTLRLQGLLPELSACSRCGGTLQGLGLVVRAGSGEALCGACAVRQAREPASRGTTGLERGGSGSRSEGETVRLSAGEGEWIRRALAQPISQVADPGPAAGIDRLVRSLFLEFTGKPFRSARFLEVER